MGSPLSPMIANLFVENLEEKAIQTATHKPSLWIHCVDDTFVIWLHRDKEMCNFHDHLNSLSPIVQFTIKKEKDGHPECPGQQSWRSSLHHCVPQAHPHRPIHPLQLPLPSKGPGRWDGCMRDRAHRICDSEDNRWSEMEPHEGVLQAIGFLSKLVKKTLSGQPRANNTPDIEPQSLTDVPKLLCLPYVHGLSEKLQKIYAP